MIELPVDRDHVDLQSKTSNNICSTTFKLIDSAKEKELVKHYSARPIF